jgi:hypothetical protein
MKRRLRVAPPDRAPKPERRASLEKCDGSSDGSNGVMEMMSPVSGSVTIVRYACSEMRYGS